MCALPPPPNAVRPITRNTVKMADSDGGFGASVALIRRRG
jgi:hypothetical protein